MSFFDTFQEMLVLLFAMAMGYLANRLGYLDGGTNRRLCKLLLNITMPAMILAAVFNQEVLPEPGELLGLLKAAAFYYGLEFLLMPLAAGLLGGTEGQKGVWRFVMIFANTAFVGYPVTVALFGQEALLYAVILVIPFNLLAYTLGPLMLAGTAGPRRRQRVSPCVVAALAALAVTLTRIPLPALPGECLDIVGGVTVPLSLLLVGSLLADLPLGKAFANPRLWALAAVRLLILPALLWGIFQVVDIEPPMAAEVAVILMSMPAALNGSMLSLEYGGDTETMAQATFLTTLCSIVTIPLIASLLL